MKKFPKFIKDNFLLILIIAVAVFVRIYRPQYFYIYNHDGDLASWMVKDILVNKHLRLVGQETSVQGVFIGPLFYYLLVPFYFFSKMDPIGGVFLSLILGVLSVFSFYFVFLKIANKKVGLIASLVYAVSLSVVLTDREVVPTTPAMLWSIWFLYAVYLLYKGRQKIGFLLTAVLLGLVWHINLGLVLVAPLVPVALIFSKKRINLKYLLVSFVVLIFTLLPFVIFESRHGFQQVNAIVSSLITEKNYIPGTSSGFAKLDRVFQLVYKNVSNIFVGSLVSIPQRFVFWAILAMFVFVFYKKVIDRKMLIIFLLWQLFYLGFFTANSLNLSEYYLNGMNVVWIGIFSLFFYYLFGLKRKKVRLLAYIFGFTILVLNIYRLVVYKPHQIGYLQKKEIVKFIKEDSRKHGYPCISVSYITNPGYELGYRYFFWLEDLHVNQPSSNSPVYTIVFPHSKVDRIDMSFGALGLILPDYQKYNEKEVNFSCTGENSNLTDPMFGYTE